MHLHFSTDVTLLLDRVMGHCCSAVVCRRRLSGSVTLPAGGPAGRVGGRRAGRRARLRPAIPHFTAGQYGYVPLERHLICLLIPLITHARRYSRGGRVSTGVCLCVCLSLYPHDISKTDAANITEIGIQMFRDESWKPVYFGIKDVTCWLSSRALDLRLTGRGCNSRPVRFHVT